MGLNCANISSRRILPLLKYKIGGPPWLIISFDWSQYEIQRGDSSPPVENHKIRASIQKCINCNLLWWTLFTTLDLANQKLRNKWICSCIEDYVDRRRKSSSPYRIIREPQYWLTQSQENRPRILTELKWRRRPSIALVSNQNYVILTRFSFEPSSLLSSTRNCRK